MNFSRKAPQITVIVGFEERAGEESNAQREKLIRQVLSNVKAVYIFRHPSDVPGHIKGCGSNQCWAMNQFLHATQEDISDWVFVKIDAQVDVRLKAVFVACFSQFVLDCCLRISISIWIYDDL